MMLIQGNEGENNSPNDGSIYEDLIGGAGILLTGIFGVEAVEAFSGGQIWRGLGYTAIAAYTGYSGYRQIDRNV